MSERHVVILGGSLAGLCAARALAPFADRITVVERDHLPDDVAERPGAPQARHVHALLIRGRRELEALFPGFDAAMRDGGALELDFLRDFATLRAQGWWQPVSSGLFTLFASRALVEGVVRRLLRAESRVIFRERTDVVGLEGSAERVTGVRVQARDPGRGAREVLAADLVVDATGRASRAPEWLRAVGAAVPEETVVDAHVAYATQWFRVPARRPRGHWWRGVWIDPKDLARDMAGVLSPVEDDRWVLTIAGGPGCHPPTDADGFRAAVQHLRAPLIAEAIADAEPLTPIYGNRETANRFRHFDRLSSPPAGFVAVGDAVCKFNPVYGQGMTSAAVVARLLGEQVHRDGLTNPRLPRGVFRSQARFLRQPWSMATGADFRFAGTEGARPRLAGLSVAYMDRLFAAGADDPRLRHTVGEVIHMLRPPQALFAPRMLARVLARTWRRAPGDGFLSDVPLGAPAA